MPQRSASQWITPSGLRVGQRFQEMRKAARQWEVECFFTDSRAVRHVCLRDILDPSRRVTLACSSLMDRGRFRPLDVRLRRTF
ncbi:hypothetical protein AAFN88_00635 [Pelagibius sp. CAU 1746]|uniref:hypothetical protein n=1 Tax=Pelagibius sp. CAU 1746 TaxID=3140370 RepID=UPI00325BD584